MSTFRSEQRIYAMHVFALFRAGAVGPTHPADRNEPGTLGGWSSDDRALLIEEGRRQLDRHGAEIERVRTRGQVLFAIAIALIGSTASLLEKVDSSSSAFGWLIWGSAIMVGVWATLGSAAVATVAARADMIHTTVLSRYAPPVEGSLAADYAAAVVAGENAVAVRLTNFRWSVSYLLVSAALALVTLGWVQVSDVRSGTDLPRSPVLRTTTSHAPLPMP